jgi:hypothetical protein
MCRGYLVMKLVGSWLKNWSFSAVDADGMSRGLLLGWSPYFKALHSLSHRLSISIKLKHKNDYFSFTAINYETIPFWEELSSIGVFHDPIMVIGGDLNFTLSLREVWGPNPREDLDWLLSLFS